MVYIFPSRPTDTCLISMHPSGCPDLLFYRKKVRSKNTYFKLMNYMVLFDTRRIIVLSYGNVTIKSKLVIILQFIHPANLYYGF